MRFLADMDVPNANENKVNLTSMVIKKIKCLKYKYISKGSFSLNVLTLMIGTTIAQVIPIATSPIFTRIYSPKDFGVFALYVAVVSMISVIATCRYEIAIMLPVNDYDSINIAVLSGIIAFIVSIVTFLITFFLNSEFIQILDNPKIAKWLYLTPLSIFLLGLYQILVYWSNRKKQFKRVAISKIVQTLCATFASLVFGFCGIGEGGLIGGWVIGQVIVTTILAWQTFGIDKWNKEYVSMKRIIKNAKEYADFLKINSLHALTDVLQSNGVIFLISTFFGSTILGIYSLSMRILDTPFSMIGTSIAQVFYQKAVEIYNKEADIDFLLKKMILNLSLISLPIFTGLFFFAPLIFTLLFGENWKDAGVYVRILSPWFYLKFIGTTISHIPVIINKQKQAFYFSSFGNVLIILSILCGSYFTRDIKITFYILTVLLSLFTVLQIKWFINISKNKKIVSSAYNITHDSI